MGNLLLIDLHFAMPASRTPITEAVKHIKGVLRSPVHMLSQDAAPTQLLCPLNDAVQYSSAKYSTVQDMDSGLLRTVGYSDVFLQGKKCVF